MYSGWQKCKKKQKKQHLNACMCFTGTQEQKCPAAFTCLWAVLCFSSTWASCSASGPLHWQWKKCVCLLLWRYTTACCVLSPGWLLKLCTSTFFSSESSTFTSNTTWSSCPWSDGVSIKTKCTVTLQKQTQRTTHKSMEAVFSTY